MKGMDPNALLAQARKMKEDLAGIEDDLANRMVEGSAGDGAVTVTANGNKEIKGVRIKPAVIDPDDPDLLEDLILLAVKQALTKATELHDEEMRKVTGGMDLPGFL